MYLVSYKPNNGYSYSNTYWPLAGRDYSFLVFKDQDEFESLIDSQGTRFLVVILTEENISTFVEEFYKSDSWVVGRKLVAGNIVAMSLPINLGRLGLRTHRQSMRWKVLFKCSETYLYTKDTWEGIHAKCPYALGYFSGGCEVGSSKCERRFDALSFKRRTTS